MKTANMAAPLTDAGEFESWLNDRLDSLEVDREVYGAYILGILQEDESDEEKGEALQGILSAFLVNMSTHRTAPCMLSSATNTTLDVTVRLRDSLVPVINTSC